jgi:hypothetical protein
MENYKFMPIIINAINFKINKVIKNYYEINVIKYNYYSTTINVTDSSFFFYIYYCDDNNYYFHVILIKMGFIRIYYGLK